MNEHVEFGRQILVNNPVDSFDGATISFTHKIEVATAESIDDMIVKEIIKMAKEEGVTTLFVLDKKHIVAALKYYKEAYEKGEIKDV